MASTPSCEREPCAATPRVSTSSHTNPLCARQRRSSVGSVTIAQSARNCLSMAEVPSDATSSSATAQMITSPFKPSDRADRAATMIAASDAFMSYAPRPYTRPSRTTGENASAIPPAPTVSMCAFSISDRPPPLPRRTPTTESRPGTGSTTLTSRPAAPSQDATNEAIAPSPEPDATRSGLTEGIATSSQIRSLSSSKGSDHARRVEAFQPQDVLKQVVISTLAVASDGASIVYVQRTVEEGKYARRLWRTTFDGGEPDQLTSAKASDFRPRFSPDASELLFISDRTGKPQVWIMSLAGGEPRQVTDLAAGVGAAEWSPDGTQILLLTGSGEKRFIVGDEDDPTARRIRDYTWRIDGAGYRDEHTSVCIVDPAAGKPWRLTDPSYNVEAAAWSPDGKHIAFTADMSKDAGLMEASSVWTVRADGKSEPRPVYSPKSGVHNLAWT